MRVIHGIARHDSRRWLFDKVIASSHFGLLVALQHLANVFVTGVIVGLGVLAVLEEGMRFDHVYGDRFLLVEMFLDEMMLEGGHLGVFLLTALALKLLVLHVDDPVVGDGH